MTKNNLFRIMNKMMLLCGLCLFISSIACSQDSQLKEHVIFFSSFDGKSSAEVALGDSQIYSAKNYKEAHAAKAGLHNPGVEIAKGKGLVGDALYFKSKNTSAIFYSANKNLGYNKKSWSGTVSFWLSLDPDKDLAPGYCDPINITDVRYNDAAFWVDFTDHNPREFRLGAMGDLAVWNPDNKEDNSLWEERTVDVKHPPFATGKWTHIVISYTEINTQHAKCGLYIDGQFKGFVKKADDPFSWEEENAKIMLGLGYTGMMDEIAVFDKSLSAEEVKFIYQLEGGLKALF